MASPGVSLKHGSVVPAARILVIEDNSADVFLLGRALDKQDRRFELTRLADGDDALAFIRREGAYANAAIPNLILVDLNLPKYDGGRHFARDPEHQASGRGSRVRVEFLSVPAGPGSAHGAGSCPIHHQAFRAGSIHGDWEDL